MERRLNDCFLSFVERKGLFTKHDRLLVAASGGIDSTVLAHLLSEMGFSFDIVHCNFKLRAAASDADEVFVRELAAGLGVGFNSRSFDTRQLAEAGESTQMTARRLRYDYFNELLADYDFLLTAHHLEDSLETMMINLVRGTGLEGLSGIPPRNGKIVRPLLECTREDIRAYAEQQQLSWREDASNAKDDYLRNRVRHQLTPVLKELGLKPKSLGNSLDRLRSQRAIYEAGLSSWRDRLVVEGEERTVIDRKQLPQDLGLAQLLIKSFTARFGFTDEEYRQMLNVAGRPTLVGCSGRVHISADRFVFEDGSGVESNTHLLPIDALPFEYKMGDSVLRFEEIARPVSLNDNSAQYFRMDGLPLHLRPRKNGDRIQPFGMAGKSKKVKDILIDAKLTGREKRSLLLLCAADGRIVAIPGLRLSEEFRLRPEDERVLRLSVLPGGG